MGIAVSLLMIAVGAIMRFAVTVKGHGFNVHTTGVVLIVVGIVGAVISVGLWASRGGFGTRTTLPGPADTRVTQERVVTEEREVR